jgi:hypothetical protein
MALGTHSTGKSACVNQLGSTNALPQNKFIAHGCAMNLFAGRKMISRFFGWPFWKISGGSLYEDGQ